MKDIFLKGRLEHICTVCLFVRTYLRRLIHMVTANHMYGNRLRRMSRTYKGVVYVQVRV